MSDIQCYYKQWDSDTWINVTYYLEQLPEWTVNLNTELLQFDITLVQPLDTSDDVIIPAVGDDICITTDDSRTQVLNNALAGMILNIRYDIKNYDPVTGFWYVRYELTIQQRNPSLEFVAFDVKTATPINDILDQIFNSAEDQYGVSFIPTIGNSADGKLNGFLDGTIDGTSVARYTNLSSNIDVESFESEGSSLTNLVNLMKTANYFFRVVYKVEPHATRVLNLVQQFKIFDEFGIIPTGSSDWISGITNETMSSGYVGNLSFIDATTTPNEIEKFPTEKTLNASSDGDKITNYFSLNALIQNGENLVRVAQFANGGLTYDLKTKAKDIVYVTRAEISCKPISVTSTTIFDVPLAEAERLQYDQAKLSKDQMVCTMRDTVGNNNFRTFTISGQTITLGSAVTSLDTTFEFILVNGHDVYQEDMDMTGIEYGVIKHTKPTENATIEFLDLDRPNQGFNENQNNSDIIVAWIYELKDRIYRQSWKSNIQKYGMFYQHEELPTPITEEQYTALLYELEKRTVPLADITFTTYRPDLVEVGWNIKVNLYNSDGSVLINRNDLTVQTAKYRFIANDRVNNQPTVEQTITLSVYRQSLQDLIKRFNKGNVTTLNNSGAFVQETNSVNNFKFDLF